ncbi:MAG: site-2 protease family protein [Clostridia bacterium]|nr:site-2 protease family protein [Clostridia bacterium]
MKRIPRFSVHPFAVSGLFLLLFASPRPYAFSVLSSVLLHELGHMMMALLWHKEPISLRIIPTGISIVLPPASSYTEEFLIAAAGPLMNVFYALLCGFLPYGIGGTVRSVSLLLATINLIPIAPLDGGRMLSSLISPVFGSEFSARISDFFSLMLLSLLWILSLYIFFYSGVNFMLLLFCAYLFSYIVLKKF